MIELISFTGAGVPVDVSSMSALQGAQGLNNWTLARQHLVRFTDVQMMVHAWVIRREYPEREAFDAFCGEHVFTHTAEKAWLLAQTWEVARRSRDMQQLARVDPDEAVELMQDFVDAGLEQRVTDLDEDDRAIVQVLAAPRRQRRLENDDGGLVVAGVDRVVSGLQVRALQGRLRLLRRREQEVGGAVRRRRRRDQRRADRRRNEEGAYHRVKSPRMDATVIIRASAARGQRRRLAPAAASPLRCAGPAR